MSNPKIQDGAAMMVTGSGNSVSGTISLSSLCNGFIAVVSNRGGTSTLSVKVNGQSCTQLVSYSNAGYSVSAWGLTNPPTGTVSVATANGGGPTFSNVCGIGYQGVSGFGSVASQSAHSWEVSSSDASYIVFGSWWNNASGVNVNRTFWPNYSFQIGYAAVGAGGSASEFVVGGVPGDISGSYGFSVDNVNLTTLTNICSVGVEIL